MADPLDKALDQIANGAKKRGLVLFVGAGINGTKCLQWEPLVDELLNAALKLTPVRKRGAGLLGSMDCYAKATLAKSILGARYTEVLRALVYGRRGGQSHVSSVARLCAAKQVKAVVTYNYDMYLEKAYSGKRPMISVGLAGQESARSRPVEFDAIPVYHVHGLLAPPGQINKLRDDAVVLAYDEYVTSMHNAASRSMATQIHLLRTHHCLFLGTSLSDWNMVRLLQAARADGADPRHWSLNAMQDFCSKTNDDGKADDHSKADDPSATVRAKSTLYATLGVKLVLCGRWYGCIYDAIESLLAKPKP